MTTDRQRLRDAFAQPGREMLPIGQDNGGKKFIKPEDATDAQVLAAYPRTGLLVFDIDTPAIERTAAVLLERWPEPLRVVKWESGGVTADDGSGPFQKQHWVIVTPAPLTTRQFIKEAAAAGVPKSHMRDSRQPSRYPLCPHRQNGMVRLIEPATVDEAVEVLLSAQALDGFADLPTVPSDEWLEPGIKHKSPMPAKAEQLLRNGRAGLYEGTHQAVFGLARMLSERGWTGPEFLALLTDPACPVLDKWLYRKRGVKGELIEGWMQPDEKSAAKIVTAWNNAVQQTAQSSTPTDSDPRKHAWEVHRWVQNVHSYLYGSRATRGSDWQLVETLGRLMSQHHSWVVLPGSRWLSLQADLAPGTVVKGLHRLTEYGVLRVEYPDPSKRLIHAARIIADASWGGDGERVAASGWTPDIEHPEVFLPARSAVWGDRVLGHSAFRVYAAATVGNVTHSEVEADTGLTLPTVRDAVQRLRREGLLVVDDSRPVTFHAVALPDPASVEARLLEGCEDRKQHREMVYQNQVEGSRETRERISGLLEDAEAAALAGEVKADT